MGKISGGQLGAPGVIKGPGHDPRDFLVQRAPAGFHEQGPLMPTSFANTFPEYRRG